MPDWNPLNWPGDWINMAGQKAGIGANDPSNPYRNAVSGVGQNANVFGETGAAAFGSDTSRLNDTRDYLSGLMQGKNSVAAEQLRQGLQQNLAAQQSLAAGAAPQNAAMAARQAAMNSARLGYGMSGQQALAGLQERNMAAQQLGQLDLGARGQDVNAATGGYNAAAGAYGQALGNPQQTWGKVLGGAINSAGGYAAGALFSDRNLKTEIDDGDGDASHALDGLKAYVYKYKDQKYGKGKQIGIMAQDLESAGLGHAVIDTPEGKAVHGGKLAGAIAAMLPGLHKRISKLEKAK